MANTMQTRMNAAAPVLKRICKQYAEDENAQLLDLMLEGQRECETHGLGGYQVVHSTKTLIHPRNRGTAMLEISEVPLQVGDISDNGFSLHEVMQASAVKLPPVGSDQRREIERKNEVLVAESCGALADVVIDSCDVMVTGCSHNTAGLKAINASALCTIDRISENGRYSPSKIIGRCPSYKVPIESGIKYFTHDYCVEEHFPEYIDLVIEASNVGSAVAKPDTFLQLCVKAHGIAQRMLKAALPDADGKKTIQYGKVIAILKRSKPALVELLPEAVKYVEQWAGGADFPQHLLGLQAAARTVDKPLHIQFEKNVLRKIMDLDFGYGLGGRYRRALMEGIVCKEGFVSSSMLGALAKKGGNTQVLALKAEGEMDEFEKAVKKIPAVKNSKIPIGLVVRQVAFYDIDVVAYVHKLNKKHFSFQEVACEHFDKISAILGGKIKNPFQMQKPLTTKSAATTAGGMRELGAQGMDNDALLEIAKSKGFDATVEVVHCSTQVHYLINSFDEDDGTVILANKGDKRKKIVISVQALIDKHATCSQGLVMSKSNRSNRSKRLQYICIDVLAFRSIVYPGD